MNLTLELPDDLSAALEAHALAKGTTPDLLISGILKSSLASELQNAQAVIKPLRTGYGSWVKYGTASSAEEIDENRRDMFRDFGQDA